MSVTYFLNFMGPVSMAWYEERGLTKYVWKKVESEYVANMRRMDIGESYMVEEVTTNYSAGRIDIHDSSKEGYDGRLEYAVPPMRSEDWAILSKWMQELETKTVLSYELLILAFECNVLGRDIRWWKDDEIQLRSRKV
jgi:hypothetical protein